MQYLAKLEGILARYFPAEMPPNDVLPAQLSNKQRYIRTHLPRFMHTLIRAQPHCKPGSSIVALGEKGHVPALLHELFQPSLLKVTTMEFPGKQSGKRAHPKNMYCPESCSYSELHWHITADVCHLLSEIVQ
jgi:hypothetical protein